MTKQTELPLEPAPKKTTLDVEPRDRDADEVYVNPEVSMAQEGLVVQFVVEISE